MLNILNILLKLILPVSFYFFNVATRRPEVICVTYTLFFELLQTHKFQIIEQVIETLQRRSIFTFILFHLIYTLIEKWR